MRLLNVWFHSLPSLIRVWLPKLTHLSCQVIAVPVLLLCDELAASSAALIVSADGKRTKEGLNR